MRYIRQNHNPFHLFHRKRSRGQRAYERQFSRFTMIVRQRWQSLLFLFGKYRFEADSWFQEQHASFFIFLRFIRTIFGPAFFAIILVVGLEVVEHFLLDTGGSFWHFALSLGFVHQLKLLLNHFGIIPGRMQLDTSTYVSLVSTVAQIAGIFLGLYFTAVGVVVSAVYSRVSGDVRTLLVQEKTGNLYMRIVALLCAVAVLLLAIHALGFPIGILNLSLLTVLSMISIFSFIELGRRIFDFFNPAVLVAYLAINLQKSIHRATSRGYQWYNPSFQNAYQNQAENLLNSYQNIVYLVTREDHPYGKTLLALARNALTLLAYYAKCKPSIPTKSLWFRHIYQHPGWLTSDYTQISLALNTATSLQPKVVPDPLWFEMAIEAIIVRILQTLIEKNDLRNAVAVLDSVRLTLGSMAERFAIEEALHLHSTIQPVILAYVQKLKSDDVASSSQVEQEQFTLSLIEFSSFLFINIILGFTRRLKVMPATAFSRAIAHIKWNRMKDIYANEVPRPVIEQLEYLWEGLAFERFIEGSLISPLWFRQQIAALGLVRFLSTVVDRLVEILESTYPLQVEILLNEKRTLLAVQLIQTGLEACQKCKDHFEHVRLYTEQLSSLRRVTDIPWSTIDWNSVDQRISAVRSQLVIALGQALPILATVPQSEKWPDYFGLAYTVLSQETYYAMAKGDEALFQKIISPVFLACLLAPVRVAGQLQNRDARMRFIYSTEPVEDMLELSGYAIIYSQLDGKTFWDTMRALWNNYFAQQPTSQDEADRIMSIIKTRQAWPTIFPRAFVRGTWKQDLEGRLRSRGLLNETFFHESDMQIQKQHTSTIIRALTRGNHWKLFYDSLDVFLAVYDREKNVGCQWNLPRGAESFADALQREEAKESDEKEAQ